MATFDAGISSLAGAVEKKSKARHLYELAYDNVGHHSVARSAIAVQFQCDVCRRTLSAEPIPQHGRTAWSEKVDQFIRDAGWVFSPADVSVASAWPAMLACATSSKPMKSVADRLVAITDNSGYRGFGMVLPDSIRCRRCAAEIPLPWSGILQFPERMGATLNVANVVATAGWGFHAGSFLCATCRDSGYEATNQ